MQIYVVQEPMIALTGSQWFSKNYWTLKAFNRLFEIFDENEYPDFDCELFPQELFTPERTQMDFMVALERSGVIERYEDNMFSKGRNYAKLKNCIQTWKHSPPLEMNL